jgi:hypothetical protein
MAENSPMSAIQQQKSFKFQAPLVSIKYTQMNVFGIPRQGTPIENRPYFSIVISNIPLPSDKGIPANPMKPWLEMCTLDADPVSILKCIIFFLISISEKKEEQAFRKGPGL